MQISWLEPEVLAAGAVPLGLRDLKSLYGQGIRAIVTLTEHPLTKQTELSLEAIDKIGLICFHAPINDQFPPNAQQVREVSQFINQMKAEKRPVYVHCAAGIGRTGTMLHAYYLAQGLSLEDAKTKVKAGKLSSQFMMLTNHQQRFLEEYAKSL